AGSEYMKQFTSALNGKSAVIQLAPIPPEVVPSMASLGAKPAEIGYEFISTPDSKPLEWFAARGSPSLLHHTTSEGPRCNVITRELAITGGTYQLRITQVVKGSFLTQSGQWAMIPDGGGAAGRGTYSFQANDSVTADSPQGSI